MSRSLAIVILVLISPWAIMKMAWFVPTVMSYKVTIEEFQRDGSAAFEEDRKRKFVRGTIALSLYFLGFYALYGLCRLINKKARSSFQENVFWVTIIITGVSITIFDSSRIVENPPILRLIVLMGSPVAASLIGVIALVLKMAGGDSERN